MSEEIQITKVIKDVQLLGHTGELRVQCVKKYTDPIGNLVKKENHVLTVSLDTKDSDSEKMVKDLIGEVCFAQAQRIGELETIVGNISKECAHKVGIAQKEASDKMILHTELLNAKDALKAHEDNLTMAKEINDEIYAENKRLKEEKEKLKAEIEALKKGK